MIATLLTLLLANGFLLWALHRANRGWKAALDGWDESNATSLALLAALKRANAGRSRRRAFRGAPWTHSNN